MAREGTSLEMCCCGTYRRDHLGTWRYPWGDPVPGAVDVTLADIVVGMSAPELQLSAMLSAGEIAVLASLPDATIDRELHLGNLPPPPRQLRGAPLWSRPVVERWLSMRPDPGSAS